MQTMIKETRTPVYGPNGKGTMRQSLDIEVWDVSPEMARRLLGMMIDNNRPPAAWHISKLARAMASGRFIITGNNNLVFDRRGRLVDGQHRLLAVIESGATVRMVAVMGVADEAVHFLDRDIRTRTIGNILAMGGHESSNNLAAAARWFVGFQSGVTLSARPNPTADEVVQIVSDFPQIAESLRFMRKGFTGFRWSKTIMAAFHAVASEYDADSASEFLLGVVNDGSGWPMGNLDPLYHLNKTVLDTIQKKKTSRDTSANALAICTVKAWNLWVDGKQCRLLRARKGEQWPGIRGVTA